MLRKSMLHLLLSTLVLAAAPAAVQAQCPTGVLSLDLKTGISVPSLPTGNIGFANGTVSAVPATAACPASAGWKMAALKIVIPTGCTQANVVVEYEGLPSAWTVNLGDSPTNDGYAGDAGTTTNDAEVWVLNEDIALANSGAAPDNPLVFQNLALTDGALKFVVKNQYVSWGQPFSRTTAPASKNLFAIPDTDPSVPAADKRAIYLGLNRVISGTHRTGCGARRAFISFK